MCLSTAIAGNPGDLDAALDAYRLERMDRTARVQIGSRLIGDHIFHPAGAEAHMRNAIMGGLGDEGLYGALSWLYERENIKGLALPVDEPAEL